MPWYQNPNITGLLGALVGAIISGAVTIYIWRKTRKITRLDCAVDDPKSLLKFASNISDKLEVKYEGEQASSAYLFPLELANTGTEPIETQPVQIRLSPGSRILNYSVHTEPEIGFGEISCTNQDGNELDLEVALLNPKDRIIIEIISLNNPDDKIDVGLKNKGVVARVYSRRSAESALSNISGDLSLTTYAAISALPLIGSIGRALTSIELAKRIDKISKK